MTARYQIAVVDLQRNGAANEVMYILDHQTGHIHRRSVNFGGQKPTVEQLIRNP